MDTRTQLNIITVVCCHIIIMDIVGLPLRLRTRLKSGGMIVVKLSQNMISFAYVIADRDLTSWVKITFITHNADLKPISYNKDIPRKPYSRTHTYISLHSDSQRCPTIDATYGRCVNSWTTLARVPYMLIVRGVFSNNIAWHET